jgi:hypothetical protein
LKKPNKTLHPTAGSILFEFGLSFPPWMSYTFARKIQTTPTQYA